MRQLSAELLEQTGRVTMVNFCSLETDLARRWRGQRRVRMQIRMQTMQRVVDPTSASREDNLRSA
jgi:hypothetical protein